MTAGRQIMTQSHHWNTPPKYVEAIRKFFSGDIDLDPCSNELSIVRARTEYRLPDTDGLAASWAFPRIYVNPPYGADRTRGTRIGDWLRRCVEARRDHGSDVVALVPVATNTGHWKEFVFGAAASVVFLADTRLKFMVDGEVSGKGAPMACALIYWGERMRDFRSSFAAFGTVLAIQSCKEA